MDTLCPEARDNGKAGNPERLKPEPVTDIWLTTTEADDGLDIVTLCAVL